MSKNRPTPKQLAYARRLWGGQYTKKKYMAQDVGYAIATSDNPKGAIESTLGFQTAMSNLAAESNNLAMTILHEFKARGVQDFSNKDLIGALNAIGGAWARFNAPGRDMNGPNSKQGMNRLRTVVLQQVENQTVQILPEPERMPTEDELNF
jgi:hypothetical protein